LPEHPYYQTKLGWRTEDFPHAARIGRSTVSIPISAKLSDEDVGDVIAAVRSAV
jgi:dTDP-4-amino-4,6-dideoxygalactose transaminase